jgi:hypothetical protein
MSANSAVTVLRSPPTVEASGSSAVTRIPGAAEAGLGDLVEGTALPVSGVPQSSQNLDAGLLSAAHFGQRRVSGLPHSAQNFLALVLSVPQFEQRIGVDPIETNVPRLLSRLRFERHLPVEGLAKYGLP